MNEQEYRQYRLLRNTMTFTLQQLWPSLKTKLYALTDEVENTSLGTDEALRLKSIIDDFQEKCIDVIVQNQWPHERDFNKEYEKNLKAESKLAKEVIGEFLDIYKDFFNVFIGSVKFYPENNHTESMSDTVKFRFYNISLRHPKDNKLTPDKCDVDYVNGLMQ